MPLRNINHGAWLLVTARLTAVYIGTAAAEAFCAAAHRAQRAKEGTGGFRLDSRLFVGAEALRKGGAGQSGVTNKNCPSEEMPRF